jgi:hypothetical protein
MLAGIVHAVMTSFPPELGNLRSFTVPPADWRVVLFLALGAAASTLFFALAPAVQAARIELVRAVRGELVRDGRPRRSRDVLVALQVTGSVMLLICAAVFLRSAWAASAVEPGIRTADVVSVRVVDEGRRPAIVDAVAREPLVMSVAANWPSFMGGLGWLPAIAETGAGSSDVTYQFVSPGYFGVFGIEIVRGRGFTDGERDPAAGVAVVSESTARQLWPGADAVGRTLRVEPRPSPAMRETLMAPGSGAADLLLARTVVIVGVSRDVAGFRLGSQRFGGAGVYLPIDTGSAATALTVRVRGDASRARQALVDRLAAIDPNMGEVSTMQLIARAEAYLLGIPFWLSLVLGVLALLLTLTGLFSVLSYLVEQRTRELGVRMALGATRRRVVELVLVQSVPPVAIGLCLGVMMTAALGGVVLATPLAAQIGSSVRLFDPVAYTGALAWIVAACACAALIPALRAARIDPVGALRRD